MKTLKHILTWVTLVGMSAGCGDAGASPTEAVAGAARQRLPCNPGALEPPPGGCEFAITLTRVQLDVSGPGTLQTPEDLPPNLDNPDKGVNWPKLLADTTTTIMGGPTSWPKGALGGYQGGEVKLFESRSPYQVLDTITVPPNRTWRYQVCFDTAGTYEDENDAQTPVNGTACVTLSMHCPTLDTDSATALVKLGNGTSLEFTVEAEMVDKDGDGIGTEDWIDDPCYDPATFHGSAGEASMVYFYYDGKGITQLVQSLNVNINKMLDDTSGYDYTHVWIDPDDPNYWLTDNDHNPFSELEPSQVADSWSRPTEKNFFGDIRRLVSEGYTITIVVMAHGTDEGWEHQGHCDVPGCNVGGDDWDEIIDNDDIWEQMHPNNIGIAVVPIRMVYSTSCVFESLNDDFGSVGTQVTSGTWSVNFFPPYWGEFSDDWLAGDRYDTAVTDSETGVTAALARTGVRAFVDARGYAWMLSDNAQLDLACFVTPTAITGKNACAEDGFTYAPGHAIEDTYIYNIEHNGYVYDTKRSGWSNIKSSSLRFIEGAASMTRSTPIDWGLQAAFIDRTVTGPP